MLFKKEKEKATLSNLHFKLTTKAIARALQPKGPNPWWLRVMVVESRFLIKYETGTTPTSLQAWRYSSDIDVSLLLSSFSENE